MIEIMTFRLHDHVDPAEFRVADARVQTEFFYHQPGLIRRTTAVAEDGEWVTVNVWESADHADASSERAGDDAACFATVSLIDLLSIEVQRYDQL